MQIVSYRVTNGVGQWRPGLVVGDVLIDGTELDWPESVRRLLELHGGDLAAATSGGQRAAASSAAVPVADVELGPPVPDPQKIIGIGLNYESHVRESAAELPSQPEVFAKFPNCLIGSRTPVQIPLVSSQVDFEGELAVVLGRRARHVSADETMPIIAGYSVLNDISARDLQHAGTQWTSGKAIDTFAPMSGLTPRDEIAEVQALNLVTRLNGREMQRSNTSRMIRGVRELVAYLSTLFTLEPGDIIATGTPEGVGVSRTPQVFLLPGDLIEVEIEGLGRLANPVVLGNAMLDGAAANGSPVEAETTGKAASHGQ